MAMRHVGEGIARRQAGHEVRRAEQAMLYAEGARSSAVAGVGGQCCVRENFDHRAQTV